MARLTKIFISETMQDGSNSSNSNSSASAAAGPAGSSSCSESTSCSDDHQSRHHTPLPPPANSSFPPAQGSNRKGRGRTRRTVASKNRFWSWKHSGWNYKRHLPRATIRVPGLDTLLRICCGDCQRSTDHRQCSMCTSSCSSGSNLNEHSEMRTMILCTVSTFICI